MGTSATPQPQPATLLTVPAVSLPSTPPPPSVASRADSFIDRMLARYGNAENALREMATQITQYADRVQELEREDKALRDRLPADGAVVLPKDAKALWEAVSEAKLTADGFKALVKEHGEWGSERAAVARRTLAATAAKAAQIPNAEVLDAELDRRGQVIEMRPAVVMQAGKQVTVQQPFVRPKDKADAPAEPLSTYVEREFSDGYKAALRAGGAAGTPAPAPAPAPGVPWPMQDAVTQPVAETDVVAKFQQQAQEARDKRPSPLSAAVGARASSVGQASHAPATPAGQPGGARSA